MDFETPKIKVYIKIDESGRIIAPPVSSIFLQDPEGYIEIDEGYGDKYSHAQSQYLPGPYATEKGIARFQWDGVSIIERTAEEIAADLAALPPPPRNPEERLAAVEKETANQGETLNEVITILEAIV